MVVRIALERIVPAPPAAVWPFVTDPALLNRWSTARIRGVDEGDGGGFGSVGALRAVRLPGRARVVLDEVVEHADPGERLVYRVYGRRSVRHHRGELHLAAHADGTRVAWDVAMDLAVPGANRLLRRALVPELEDSLDRLQRVVAGAETAALPPPRVVDDAADLDALEAAAVAVAASQREMAEAMLAAGDTRHWFSRVYQYVTEAMIAACRVGTPTHPAWVLRLIPRFHALYGAAVAGSAPAPHWRDAFERIAKAEGASGGSAAVGFWQALVAGAKAHIEGDLPVVLADVYRTWYADRCDYVRFRADYLVLAAPLAEAWERLSAEVPAAYFPGYARALQRLFPPELADYVLSKRFYDILLARREAFDRGRALAVSG